ncbi:1-deoxy-D-xylulose-5-phosphate reductoisomerase, partial [Nocardioides sp. Y6]|nr:1-deoxy-D-xylulose-5-phosphate reductoisomerase [Nocardioides malaquae]
ANEVAVAAFLAGRIAFPGIPALVDAGCVEAASARWSAPRDIAEALAIDHDARRRAAALLSQGPFAAT